MKIFILPIGSIGPKERNWHISQVFDQDVTTYVPIPGNYPSIPRSLGHNDMNFVALYGGRIVEMLNYEPDINTFRYNFYYNSRLNKLFKKQNNCWRPILTA